MRNRSIKSVKHELIKKSREAMMAAVQIFNNPQITFKTEAFITLAMIAWTYLMHAYYRSKGIDYLYSEMNGKRMKYCFTPDGAKKTWDLARCIKECNCPLDGATQNNLRFLIGIRNKIEHQMSSDIDVFISAKLQACAMNFDYYLQQFFGAKYGVSNELALSIQFSSISPNQEQMLIENSKLTSGVKNFICSLEDELSDDDMKNPRYAYHVAYVPISVNRRGQADKVVEFLKADTLLQEEIDRVLVKEIEKKKYLPGDIVAQMQQEGYSGFKMGAHTRLWQEMDAKNPIKQYGVRVSKTWYWYDSWLTAVRKHCEENLARYQ